MTVNKKDMSQSGYHWTDNEIKAINTLYGLCMGVVADGRVDDSEVIFLDTWLRDHERYLHNYPLNLLHQRIERILADGIITEDERADLHQTIGQILGGTPQETGATGGFATQLPVENIESMHFDDAVFCFTGAFVFGQRKDCEKAVVDRGAMVSNSVTKKLDYLVIGELASRDWLGLMMAGLGRDGVN